MIGVPATPLHPKYILIRFHRKFSDMVDQIIDYVIDVKDEHYISYGNIYLCFLSLKIKINIINGFCYCKYEFYFFKNNISLIYYFSYLMSILYSEILAFNSM